MLSMPMSSCRSFLFSRGVVYPGCKVERAGVGPLRIAQMVSNATFQQSESQTQLGLDALQEFLDKVKDHGQRQDWLQICPTY